MNFDTIVSFDYQILMNVEVHTVVGGAMQRPRARIHREVTHVDATLVIPATDSLATVRM